MELPGTIPPTLVELVVDAPTGGAHAGGLAYMRCERGGGGGGEDEGEGGERGVSYSHHAEAELRATANAA